MKKLTFPLFFLLLSFSIFAQQKELTLEDAILKRFTELGPERLADLQWVKNTDMVSWQSKDQDKILIRKPGTRAPIEEVNLEDINKALGTEMKGWNFAYNASRKGPWMSLANDRGRLRRRIEEVSRIISPILDSNHDVTYIMKGLLIRCKQLFTFYILICEYDIK